MHQRTVSLSLDSFTSVTLAVHTDDLNINVLPHTSSKDKRSNLFCCTTDKAFEELHQRKVGVAVLR